MKAWLEIISGPRVNDKIDLRANQIRVIGRRRESDESFPDDGRMSGRHFSLRTDTVGCYLEDLQSSNGTKVNGTRIMNVALQDDDVIEAGSTKFRVHLKGGNAEAAQTQLKSIGRFSSRSSIATLGSVGNLSIPYQAEKGPSGLSLLRGRFKKEFVDGEDLTPGSLVQALATQKNCWLLFDPHRLPTEEPPEPEEAPEEQRFDGTGTNGLSESPTATGAAPPAPAVPTAKAEQALRNRIYLFDWLGPQVAEAMSPYFIKIDPQEEERWKPLVDQGWGNDAVVVLIASPSKPDLIEHLRMVARQGESVVGICWPSVLAPMLLFSQSDITRKFMQGVESVLVELPDLPETWQIVGDEQLEKSFQDTYGFVPERTIPKVEPKPGPSA